MSTEIRVLMVEDSEDDALLTLRELRKAGYEVERLRVETELALRRALQRGTWDLVTIDYNLPQLTGLEALALVRAHDTDMPAIVVSGTIGEDTAVNCMRAGAHDYVMKDNLKRLGPAAARELADVEGRRVARLQRERTARIIDAADTLVVGCDPEGRITVFNSKCEKMTGWSRDDVIGRAWAELAPDNDWLTSALGTFDEGRDYGSVTEFEYPLVDVGGRERIITWYPTPILDASGALVELVAIGMDITAQIAAEQQYRTLVDTMGDGLSIIDLSGRITYANEALCNMLEYDLGELVGKPLVELCVGENRAILEAQLAARFTSGSSAEYEISYTAKSGRQVPVLVSATALRNSADVIVGAFAIIKDMTEREQAQAALRESEARFRAVFETARDSIFIKDAELRYVMVNPAMAELFGVSVSELLGNTDEELFGEEAGTHIREVDSAVLAGETINEEHSKPVDGKSATFHVVKVPLRDASGEVVGLCGIARDITEREQARTALRESEERYRGLVDLLPQTVFETDREANITLVNQAALATFGYTQEDVEAGMNVLKMLAPEERELAATRLAQARNGQDDVSRYYTALRKDGATFPALIYWSHIMTDGERTGSRGIVIDITELKQAEVALAESEANLSAILKAAPMGIGLLHDRVFAWVNEGMTAMSGYSEEELLGQNVRIVYETDEEYERVGDELYDQIRRTGVGETSTEGRRKDGEVVNARLRVGAVDTEDPSAGVIFSLMDVTEQRLLEEQLQQAQKMEAVGQLAGGIAHDFNNLLTAILGNTELLSQEIRDSEGLTDYTDEVLKAGRRAVGLTRQLLAFSRKQVLAPEVLDLNETFSELATMLRRLIEENVELVTCPGADLHKIEADPGQVEQIIINLAVNARDAMPDGGTLTIETSNVNLGEEYVRLHWDASVGPHVMLAVSDTGTGMDENVMAHIFEPFFTTKDEGEGTGLGLSTVHGIVQQSGGSIHVYSEPGVGTTFRVYFPRVEGETAAAVEAPEAEPAPGGSETILIVEDEAAVRELVARFVAAQGYNILVADNGQEALAIFESDAESIDLMMTDMIMPGMSGDELAEKARQLAPELKVIYLSGYTANAIVARGILKPGVHLVQKPFEPDALLSKIREVLDEPAQTHE